MRWGAGSLLLVLALGGSACSARHTTTAPAPGRTPGAGRSFDCSAPISRRALPEPGFTVVHGALALETREVEQVTGSGGSAPYARFAKSPLLVHAGPAAVIAVPPAWRGRAALTWGNHAPRWTTALRIDGCRHQRAPGRPWLVYPGGISVDRAVCLPLLVSGAGFRVTVRVPVGTRCR